MPIEKIGLYPKIGTLECAFEGAHIGSTKCKLYTKKSAQNIETPIMYEIEPDCINIHPENVMDIQFSVDLGGNHAVLKIEFDKTANIECELEEHINRVDFRGEFLKCKREGLATPQEPEFGHNWEDW